MIVKIFSNLERFKTLEFKPGLNILVSERHEASGDRDSRNGTGKTSMIELLHFIMSGKTNRKDDFHKNALLGHLFSAAFKYGSDLFNISRRSGAERDESFWNEKPIRLEELRTKLSQKWFSLPVEENEQKYSPKFGSLVSFFVRKARNGAFEEAIKTSSQQKLWDSQISIAYLLGFDWRIIQKLQNLKDEKKQIDELCKMLKEGLLSGTSLDIAKMVAERDILDGDVERKRKEVNSFQVADNYKKYEKKANSLTRQLASLNEENLYDLAIQSNINAALEEIKDADKVNIEGVYEQARVFFEKIVLKRLDDVENFHKQITENRKLQLNKEKQEAEQRIIERHKKIAELQIELKSSMDILKSHIAFERMVAMQSELNALEARLNQLNLQIPKLQGAESDKDSLKRKIDEQVDLIGDDVQQRSDRRSFATEKFAEVSRFLYEESGVLSLGKSPGVGGLKIDIEIRAKKSGGKNHMQVFCFDWVLAQASKQQGKFPGFLVHDSHIFDGVDGRQIGRALRFAQKKCYELGIQYIVAINSDDLEKIKGDREGSFDPFPYIMETRLSDSEGGGLFGVMF